MFTWYSAVDQLHLCGYASSTRSKVTSCTMSRLKAQIYSIKAEESWRLHVLKLYSIGESVQRIHHLPYLKSACYHLQHIAKDC